MMSAHRGGSPLIAVDSAALFFDLSGQGQAQTGAAAAGLLLTSALARGYPRGIGWTTVKREGMA